MLWDLDPCRVEGKEAGLGRELRQEIPPKKTFMESLHLLWPFGIVPHTEAEANFFLLLDIVIGWLSKELHLAWNQLFNPCTPTEGYPLVVLSAAGGAGSPFHGIWIYIIAATGDDLSVLNIYSVLSGSPTNAGRQGKFMSDKDYKDHCHYSQKKINSTLSIQDNYWDE